MPILDESHRASAEITQTGHVSALNWLLSRAADFLFPCRHKNTTLPYNDRQHCLDCGASRLYIFHSDFEHADAGIFIGPWKRHTAPAQDAHRVVASKLIDNAIANYPLGRTPANVPMNGREAILFAGADSPLFKPQRRAARTSIERVTDTANAIFERHTTAGSAVSR